MALPFQLALGNNTPTTVFSGAGRIDLPDPTFLDVGGGLNGQVLTTDGAKGLYWANVTATGADAPSDGTSYGRVNAGWSRTVAVAGDTMQGFLTLSGAPTLANHAATKAYVDARTSFGDAPSDGFLYGRGSLAWARAVPLAGGTMTGPLVLSGPPTQPLHAVTKDYVDFLAIDAGVY